MASVEFTVAGDDARGEEEAGGELVRFNCWCGLSSRIMHQPPPPWFLNCVNPKIAKVMD